MRREAQKHDEEMWREGRVMTSGHDLTVRRVKGDHATLGDWRHLERWPEAVAAVSAEEVQRVARAYLVEERRSVVHVVPPIEGEAGEGA